MKRDLDLMREILLKLEVNRDRLFPPYLPEHPDHVEVTYQVLLLHDAGYIEAELTLMQEPPGAIAVVTRITNSGHDYLDSVRDAKVWEKTKTKLEKVGGGATLEFVKEMAAKTMAELIKSSWGG